jgi:hypothetical protein
MRAVWVVLFWIAAAVLVLQFAAPAVKVVVIVAVAYTYMRLAAPSASLDHAIVVGVVWLLLDIVTELSTATVVGHGWYGLIGSPAQDRMRDLVMLAWLAAPAVFARSQLDASGSSFILTPQASGSGAYEHRTDVGQSIRRRWAPDPCASRKDELEVRSQLDARAQLDDAVGGHAEVESGAAIIAFEDRKQHQA